MKSLLDPLLSGLSLIFLLAIRIRLYLYQVGLIKSERLPGKTWSIGNISVGGTGKSPITISLAQMLVSSGYRPAILTRGYGSPIASRDSMVLLAGKVITAAISTSTIPDEARMQSAKLPTVPVIAGPDRVAAAKNFLQNHPQYQPTHWLLDDGYQHLKLERDLNLVLLDARTPFPAIMPLGRAREPARNLDRANLIVFTRSDEHSPSEEEIHRVSSFTMAGTPVLKTRMRTSPPILSVDGNVNFELSFHSPTALVSGIADPKQLLEAVKAMQIEIGGHLSLGDHEPIPRDALHKFLSDKRSLLTTAKDYWRDPEFFGSLSVPVFILDLEVSWDQINLRETLREYI